ncbi:MAG: hypothetical protein IKV66_11895 [Clostridia bacterium]|nr:hypothetical protein [Clostridia bacterium]
MQKQNYACRFASLLLLTSMLASCGSSVAEPAVTDAVSDTVAATETEIVDTSLKTALPDDLDFGGTECNISNISTNSWITQMTAEAENGETLNDAIYRRNLLIEDKLNVKLTELYSDRDALPKEVKKLLAAGDDTYEIFGLTDRDALSLAQEGGIIPMQNMPNIDLTREYWAQDLNSDISIGGNLYFSYGDFNISSFESVNVLLVNLEMNSRYDLENPYDMVLDGTWTLDKLHENMLAVVQDLNGDGKFDDADQYGITSAAKQVLPCFWIASGLKTIEKDENDLPYLALEGNEAFANFYERILDMMWTGNVYFNSNVLKDYANNTVFINGQVLYNVVRVAFMKFYRDMDINYAIIPYPKATAEQEDYFSRFEGGVVNFVLETCSDVEMTGAVMELMACESRNIVVPAYYEDVLKGKYARDEKSTQMLDIIYGNRVCDFGDTFWTNNIRDGVFAQKFERNDRNLQSTIERISKLSRKDIEACIECFTNLD